MHNYILLNHVLNRYIAVCFPFFRLRHKIKARFYIIPILLFAPLYNVPRFFEFQTVKNVTFACLDDHLHMLYNVTKNTYSLNKKNSKNYSWQMPSVTEYLKYTLPTDK